MWDKIIKYLPMFSSAVLTSIDEAGYPYSIRCNPQPDTTNQVLRLEMPSGTTLYAGPASLLCHWHDEKLGNQKVFVIRGKLEQDGSGWLLRPEKFIPNIGTGGAFGTIRLLREAARTTKAYLKKRGLARPTIDWDGLVAIKTAVKNSKSA